MVHYFDCEKVKVSDGNAELKVTCQEIKNYVLKEFGLTKSENAKVPQYQKEKENAIKAALKYFVMI
nr:hypothetical protein [uncultured Blautia sp.]